MYWHRVYMDELTGVPNRRALDERLAALEDSYSLAMVDIDHFKKFNDSYGHEEGDNVLRLVAHHLAEGSEHRAYRYGGEEFCLVFQGWDAAKAEGVCDGVRRSLAEREFSIRLPGKIRSKTGAADRGTLKGKSEKVKITLSMGLAQSSPRFPYPHEVIKLADQALYQAKDAGRNRVARAEQKDLK
jgi:diguanylate cyclase (GGDEF)-like protein